MHPQPIGSVPEDTARVAKSAFPKGNLYMHMRDVLGTTYGDEDFSELFEGRGRPAIAPWRLALVTVMLFSEGLSDRQAAEAVRARIDWNFYDVVKRREPDRTPYRRAASPTGR
jgi:transposase